MVVHSTRGAPTASQTRQRNENSIVWKSIRASDLRSGDVFRWDSFQVTIFNNFLKQVGLRYKNCDITPLLVDLGLDGYYDVQNRHGESVYKIIDVKVRRKLDSAAKNMDSRVLEEATYGSPKPQNNTPYSAKSKTDDKKPGSSMAIEPAKMMGKSSPPTPPSAKDFVFKRESQTPSRLQAVPSRLSHDRRNPPGRNSPGAEVSKASTAKSNPPVSKSTRTTETPERNHVVVAGAKPIHPILKMPKPKAKAPTHEFTFKPSITPGSPPPPPTSSFWDSKSTSPNPSPAHLRRNLNNPFQTPPPTTTTTTSPTESSSSPRSDSHTLLSDDISSPSTSASASASISSPTLTPTVTATGTGLSSRPASSSTTRASASRFEKSEPRKWTSPFIPASSTSSSTSAATNTSGHSHQNHPSHNHHQKKQALKLLTRRLSTLRVALEKTHEAFEGMSTANLDDDENEDDDEDDDGDDNDEDDDDENWISAVDELASAVEDMRFQVDDLGELIAERLA
ncbi:hypothetical protein F4778DRAFT_778408 [Xylariomycetidae sp. FL2044]|nr:hypothetical protein F4778DRAFT_778408 [Xylariomycetidae sp. FL2044]